MNKTRSSLVRKRPGIHSRPHIAFKMASDGIMKLQRTIGNQAVQHLLQRAPDSKEDDSRPHALATLVLSSKGKLPGESRIAGHEGKMEILSIGFDEISRPDKRNPEADEPYISLTVSRYADKSSQALMNASAKGEHLTSATFEIIRFDADGKVTLGQTFDFSDGLITSYQMQDSGGSDGRPMEVMGIQFPMKSKK
jgi:type VI secretion system Hcp family effector